jgi:amino acid transporter
LYGAGVAIRAEVELATRPTRGAALDKGLKSDALGFGSSLVIGVASTAPGYSVAASLGVVAASVATQSPAVLWLAFLPMLCSAVSYYALNRVDPDCGTTFTWVTRSMGPWVGWMSGWALLVADLLIMASLGQIAGKYSFRLFGADALAESTLGVTCISVAWVVLMTWICYVGIEVSARTQQLLLAAEVAVLALFAVVALGRVWSGGFSDSLQPSLHWLNPFELDAGQLNAGVLTAVFIYWGWDTAVAVNEETERATHTPGHAAVWSTFLLLGIYLLVAVAAQAVHGPQFLAQHKDDVLSALGSQVLPFGLDKLLDVAVLTSASAATQTTILPATRSMLAMAAHGAAPRALGAIEPRYLTPGVSTLWMGGISIVWCVALSLVSQNVIADSVTATGLAISFYLSITALASVIYFRRALANDWRTFVLAGLVPLVGFLSLGYVFARSCVDLLNPANSESGAWLGVSLPLLIALLSLATGALLMLWMRRVDPAFFRRRPEAAHAETRL